jgi:catechol 2,3-dioxygenase-like lactoylglutathione lyase family enzyme
MKITLLGFCLLAMFLLGAAADSDSETHPAVAAESIDSMDLGNFSISLAVKNLAASRAFYENLGFTKIGGEPTQNWLILRNGHATIGLFQGMFEQNIMTFNPGWSRDAENLEEFTDVRVIQKRLQAAGITLTTETDGSKTGPANFTVMDPDGNLILFDQHR